MKRFVGSAVLFAAVLALTGSAAAQRQLPKRILWWDDPVIAEQVGLSEEQRAKMSQAFAAYEKRAGQSRKDGVSQKPYLTALEVGDWEKARQEADRWLASDQVPKRAMAELKIEVLPILSSEQRARLMEHYPRLIRRPWNPAAHWGGRAANQRKGPKRHREGAPGKPPRKP